MPHPNHDPGAQAPTAASEEHHVQTLPPEPLMSSWPIAIQSLEGNAFLILVPIDKPKNGEQAWSRIRERVLRVSSEHVPEDWISMILAKTVVGTGKVQQARNIHRLEILTPSASPPNSSTFQITPSNHNFSTQHFRISLHDFKHDSLLTAAFHHPNLLSQEKNYATLHHHLAFKPAPNVYNLSGHSVPVIRKTLDKTKVAWLLIFLLIISPGLGTIVGICSHKAEIGFAVSAGVFALASFLQGFVTWLHS
ncbi:hypothetical protein MMC28_007115 [Mycoblastus sanguinarius]|nr:hypothetical protein [Mycoblastus sanguinarius]